MKKSFTYSAFVLMLFWLLSITALAQTRVAGKVTDESKKEELTGISIAVKGKVIGTITDQKGNFSLSTNTPTPFTVAVSGVGFQTQEFVINGDRTDLNVSLREQVTLGQEVVVAASRVEESVMQSPVSIEKMDIRAIQNTPAPSFYDALRNLKGVEMSTQSVTFSNFNTRGFSGNGNTRVVQMMDGMDNQAPGLNFSVANIVGMSELDVESVELLPGAASALYGPNAINGLLLTTSKSPFLYQGLSANAKVGLMNASNRTKRYSEEKLGATPYTDFSIRYAKAFNNRFAFKVNVGYLTAQDWQATDYRDQSLVNGAGLSGTRATNRGYDGINIYGDVDPGFSQYQILRSALAQATPGSGSPLLPLNQGIMQLATQFGPAAGLTPTQAYDRVLTDLYANPLGFNYTRTGYRERDLVDYSARSLKLNGSLHYRIGENAEAILQANWGTGTTVYTGADRYYLNKFNIGQYKAEIRGSNFFVRAYTTQERSGDAYAVGIAGLGMNNTWIVDQTANGPVVNTAPTATYFGTVAGTYAGVSFPAFVTDLQTRLAVPGVNPLVAYQGAVLASQANSAAYFNQVQQLVGNGQVYKPGSPEFEAKLREVTGKAIPGDANGVGAKFQDRTNLYHTEAMYNFNKVIDPKTAEIIVGGNYRVYELNSGGTIFYSNNGKEPTISEFGLYAQVQKSIADKLRLTGALRFDKNENFKGQFNPRLSAVYSVDRNNNIRASFQTGFRIPTTQDQYIDLLTPQARLIGSLSPLLQKYNLTPANTFTYESILAGQPKAYDFPTFKPERVSTIEFGYKGLINKRLLIDAYYYNSTYHDFIGTVTLIQPTGATTRNVYAVTKNYTSPIKTQGFGIGLDYSLPGNFQIGGNVSNNTLNTGGVSLFSGEMNKNTLEDGFQVRYNTPKYRYNVSLGNRNIKGSGFGFNVVYRYQDAFEWQSSLGNPNINITSDISNRPIIAAFGTLDAQISKRVPSIHSTFKIGGSNILQKEYTTGWGNPTVGSIYYVSLTFDQLMN
ncbi:TonB-dependent receptor [Spirosoma endophyticum]|nr:TonB-dependent receptor [Spirosoma endophyticum]